MNDLARRVGIAALAARWYRRSLFRGGGWAALWRMVDPGRAGTLIAPTEGRWIPLTRGWTAR